MKNLGLVIGLAVLSATAIALGVTIRLAPSPEVPSSKTMHIEGGASLRVVRFDGHEYIAFRRGSSGSLCHSESCPCKK
jgi:hypothetical protein